MHTGGPLSGKTREAILVTNSKAPTQFSKKMANPVFLVHRPKVKVVPTSKVTVTNLPRFMSTR